MSNLLLWKRATYSMFYQICYFEAVFYPRDMFLKKNRALWFWFFCLFSRTLRWIISQIRFTDHQQKTWNWRKGNGGNKFYLVEVGNCTAGKGEGNESPFKFYLPTCSMLIPTWPYNDGCIVLILEHLLWFCHWNPYSGAVLGKKSHSQRFCTMYNSWKVQVGVPSQA